MLVSWSSKSASMNRKTPMEDLDGDDFLLVNGSTSSNEDEIDVLAVPSVMGAPSSPSSLKKMNAPPPFKAVEVNMKKNKKTEKVTVKPSSDSAASSSSSKAKRKLPLVQGSKKNKKLASSGGAASGGKGSSTSSLKAISSSTQHPHPPASGSGSAIGKGKRPKESLLPSDFQPSSDTVLVGRDKGSKSAEGNKRLRVIAQSLLPRYANATKKETKSEIVTEIVDQIRSNCPPGIPAFVKCSTDDGRWYEVADSVAREKVGYVIRDLLADKYKSSSASKNERRRKKIKMEQEQVEREVKERLKKRKEEMIFKKIQGLNSNPLEQVKASINPSMTMSNSSLNASGNAVMNALEQVSPLNQLYLQQIQQQQQQLLGSQMMQQPIAGLNQQIPLDSSVLLQQHLQQQQLQQQLLQQQRNLERQQQLQQLQNLQLRMNQLGGAGGTANTATPTAASTASHQIQVPSFNQQLVSGVGMGGMNAGPVIGGPVGGGGLNMFNAGLAGLNPQPSGLAAATGAGTGTLMSLPQSQSSQLTEEELRRALGNGSNM